MHYYLVEMFSMERDFNINLKFKKNINFKNILFF